MEQLVTYFLQRIYSFEGAKDLFSNATHLSKIANQTTHQMSVERETFLLPRVPVYGTILCVIHAYEISVYSVLECINTTSMHTISRLFTPFMYIPLASGRMFVIESIYIYNIINITSIAHKSSGGRAQKRNKT